MKKHLVMLVGLPAAGKSTIVKDYLSQGYEKLSRDDGDGATADKFLEKVAKLIELEEEKIILDNTYMTRDSRSATISLAKFNGYTITGIYLKTSIEDAMYNAVTRMITRHGKLFQDASDYKVANDPNMFPIAALYKARKIFEEPTMTEGFSEIKPIDFKRASKNGYTNKAIILDYDGTLRKTKSGEYFPRTVNDIEIIPGRADVLKRYQAQGYKLLGVSNQSGVAKGDLSYDDAEKCFEKTNELLGLDIDVRFCHHKVPPITCYCRKPGVGYGVEFIEKYKLNPSETIMVGDMTSDATFAKRCGFKYIPADKFFV